MQYPEDFLDAHRRHWCDAELLFKHRRWANADQLYGLSAECGLKAVMQVLEIGVDSDGNLRKTYRKHIQDLWPIFITFISGKNSSQYLDIFPKEMPFRNWSQHNRYANSHHFDEVSLGMHRDAANAVVQMVRTAKEDKQS